MIHKAFMTMLLLLTFVLASCENPGDSTKAQDDTASPEEKIRIALVMKTLTNPFFITMEEGARKAEKDFGIELVVRTAAQETSINQQIDIVDRLVRENQVEAIVIAPGDSVQLIPALKAAQDHGIKVVNIDNRLDSTVSERFGLNPVPFISVNNENAAYLSAKYISDQISSPTNIAILEGIITAKNGQDRKAGALRAFSENPLLTVVASESAHWKVDEGYEVIKGIYAETLDIGAIFCANDMMAMGVLRFLEETGRSKVLVAAFDAIDLAKGAIQEGKLAVSIDQLPKKQGYLGIQTAVEMLNGQTPPAEIFIDALVVDKASLK